MNSVRLPAVAGAFYSGNPEALQSQIGRLLASASTSTTRQPKALIAPHAGYIYSGAIAASAYGCLLPYRDLYRRVILLGPAHRVRFRGVALPATTSFATPLGEIALDQDACRSLRSLPLVCVSEEAHALEHSLEVHLPFLQNALTSFTLVPLAVGEASSEEIASVLDALWGDEKTLIVVSSDLSHYLPYAKARECDEQSARMILGLRAELNHDQACGATPINGLLHAAQRRGLRTQMLDLRNSDDTAGDRNRVVGYGSFAFYEQPDMSTNESALEIDGIEGNSLLSIARAAIASRFGLHFSASDEGARLQLPGASFVTLRQNGQLRGCIGSLVAHRKLSDDVRANAHAAAFEDPRFAPLRFEELRSVRIEISVLSELQTIACADEAEAVSQLRPGIDGLVVQHGTHRGTFLPQVWEHFPQPHRFLAELKRKAGLAPDFWDTEMRLSRYRVAKWAEAERP